MKPYVKTTNFVVVSIFLSLLVLLLILGRRDPVLASHILQVSFVGHTGMYM